MRNLYDLYEEYWIPLGQILTDMEREGIYVNKKHLEEISVKSDEDAK